MKKFTINGKPSELGTFKTVPGTYRIKLPGYKMILPTNVVLRTDSLRESVQVGANTKVPAKLHALMEEKHKKYESIACKLKFTKQVINTGCWSNDDVSSASSLISGKQLDYYDSSAITKARASGLKCVEQETALTSASSVLTHYLCTSTITQTVRTFLAAEYEQGDPIYTEVPVYTSERYDSCPSAPYYCYEYRQVQTGTETRLDGYKQGPLISPAKTATGIFQSTMERDLYIRGTLISPGKYTAKVDYQ
jgi:hypothetical protein